MSRLVTPKFALGNESRARIMALVRETPGITLTDLASRLECQTSNVIWHTTKLGRAGLLRSDKVGGHRIFYARDGGIDTRRRGLEASALRHPLARCIYDFVRRNPGATTPTIQGVIPLTPTGIRWHIARLLEGGLLQSQPRGRALGYFATATDVSFTSDCGGSPAMSSPLVG